MKNSIIYGLCLILLAPLFLYAQGINYPANAPVNNGGAGNARTDADNLFTRNNAAALTDIEDEETGENKGRWRILSEFHSTFYTYKRQFTPPGFNQTVSSKDSIIVPSASGEATYTAGNRKYAFGIGVSQTFGFESKLKDSEQVLGSRAQFFDTKIASNDLALAGAVRLHEKFSIGGSFIIGRGFLLQTAPIGQLALIGINRSSRLDVKETGGFGASFNLHFRPTEKVNFGFNFKTARKYNFEGTLDTVQPVITPSGLQLFPVKLNVRVPFELPLIAETGVKIEPHKRLFLDFDYRFYNYAKSLKQLNVTDRQSGATLAAQNINAKNVHVLSFGGAYRLNSNLKTLFGFGFMNNALSDAAFSPALNNSGGISFSGGLARHVSGLWMNVGVTAIFALNREIPVAAQNAFPGRYQAGGLTIGFGIRK